MHCHRNFDVAMPIDSEGGRMPSVGFIVGQPSLVFRQNLIGSDGWRLGFDIQLANSFRQKVSLTTEEESLSNLDGSLAFEDTNSEPYLGFTAGSLSYWEGCDDEFYGHPSSYTLVIRLPPDELRNLRDAIAQGNSLQSVSVRVPAMKYGWQPDGSGKEWDNAANPGLEIDAFALYFGKPEEEEVVPDPPETEVNTEVKSLLALRDVQRTLSYILLALIGLILVTYIRK